MLDIPKISSGLSMASDGIWYGDGDTSLSYPVEGNDICFTVEDDSFWFKHRNDCIVALVSSYPPENNGYIFDVGGGNGCVTAHLIASGFKAVLIEPGHRGAANGKARGISDVVCSTLENANFKPQSLPAVGLFDVLEHIEDDLSFLLNIRELLTEKGYLYLTVPSYNFLWSHEDIIAGHFRRYTRGTLCSLLHKAGFKINFFSYFFRFLLPPVFILRTLPYRLGVKKGVSSDNDVHKDHAERVKGKAAKNILDLLLRTEVERLTDGKPMSFGGSCILVAQPSD